MRTLPRCICTATRRRSEDMDLTSCGTLGSKSDIAPEGLRSDSTREPRLPGFLLFQCVRTSTREACCLSDNIVILRSCLTKKCTLARLIWSTEPANVPAVKRVWFWSRPIDKTTDRFDNEYGSAKERSPKQQQSVYRQTRRNKALSAWDIPSMLSWLNIGSTWR